MPSSKGHGHPQCDYLVEMLPPHIERLNFLHRFKPMEVKSTNTPDSQRTAPGSAPRLHFPTLRVTPQIMGLQSVLIVDDVVKYGTISEAARNLVELCGVSQFGLLALGSSKGEYQVQQVRWKEGVTPEDALTGAHQHKWECTQEDCLWVSKHPNRDAILELEDWLAHERGGTKA
eukprot:TRINITY_DN41510_c0_g1_i2.p1 TRINITY_DN41510_c0_g1~~TRINITY_DN41510_c0_g1_i2.p1  ORF type:complete len:174 (+),score=4.53 TRINITY_DN41510_c0_g1_i2:280-801(+)